MFNLVGNAPRVLLGQILTERDDKFRSVTQLDGPEGRPEGPSYEYAHDDLGGCQLRLFEVVGLAAPKDEDVIE